MSATNFSYLKPSELDAHCQQDSDLNYWFTNCKNVEKYLRSRALSHHIERPDWGLEWAAEEGSQILINYFTSRGVEDQFYNQALIAAVKFNHPLIVDLMIQSGANNYDAALEVAAFLGNEQIIDQILDYEQFRTLTKINGRSKADIYNLMLQAAAEKNHRHIVIKTLALGAHTYRVAINNASINGHKEIVELIEFELKNHYYRLGVQHGHKQSHKHSGQ